MVLCTYRVVELLVIARSLAAKKVRCCSSTVSYPPAGVHGMWYVRYYCRRFESPGFLISVVVYYYTERELGFVL